MSSRMACHIALSSPFTPVPPCMASLSLKYDRWRPCNPLYRARATAYMLKTTIKIITLPRPWLVVKHSSLSNTPMGMIRTGARLIRRLFISPLRLPLLSPPPACTVPQGLQPFIHLRPFFSPHRPCIIIYLRHS